VTGTDADPLRTERIEPQCVSQVNHPATTKWSSIADILQNAPDWLRAVHAAGPSAYKRAESGAVAIPSSNQAFRVYAAYALAVLPLLWVAAINGFPLLFSDSGGYLRTGTEQYFPLDRPASYGLLLLPFYTLGGLWAAVVAQAAFVTWLIARTLRAVVGRCSPGRLFGTTAALAAGSSLPWFVGQIMPDLFAGVVGLLVYLLVCADDRLARWERIAFPLLLAGIIACHLSFVPIAIGATVAAMLCAFRTVRRAVVWSGSARAAGAIVLAVLGLSTMNLIAEHQFRPSLNSNKFLLARLLDARIAQPVIADACAKRQLSICAMLPALDRADEPLPGQAYLWDPLSQRGAIERRDPARLDADEATIIRRTFAARPGAIARMVWSSWVRQIGTAQEGDGMVHYDADMQVSHQIATHFSRSWRAWQGSREQAGTLQSLAIIPEHVVTMLFILATLAIGGIAFWRRADRLGAFAVVMLVTLLANAAACGVLSGVFDRYQARISWLLPLVAIVAIQSRWQRRGIGGVSSTR